MIMRIYITYSVIPELAGHGAGWPTTVPLVVLIPRADDGGDPSKPVNCGLADTASACASTTVRNSRMADAVSLRCES